MKLFNWTDAALALLLLPIICEAHPGHEGVPVHELSSLILALAACYAVKKTVTVLANMMTRQRSR